MEEKGGEEKEGGRWIGEEEPGMRRGVQRVRLGVRGGRRIN